MKCHSATTGRLVAKRAEKCTMTKCKEDTTGSKASFLRAMVTVLLVIGGVKMNMDLQVLHYEGGNKFQ
jgi:hypothetical protein